MVNLSHDAMLDDVEIDSSGEESGCEDNEKKEKKHRKLLNDLDQSLGNRKKKQFSSSRTEASREISEYNWSSNADKVSLSDLVGSLDSTCKSVAKVKKKLSTMENKTQVLEKPLEKVQKARVDRSVAYEETSKDISKWNATVQKNREAEQVTFPLANYKPPAVSTKNMIIEYRPQNEMEKQISAVLHGSAHLLERKDKELTQAEEKALESVDLEEALERRKELQKTRALQSYYEAKCHRIKKIKSKKYHRMLKKEQKKGMSKTDLETLSKENPELFASEMEKVEQLRAKERASLRHGNHSKWAKNLITRGHKSTDDQDRIREQLRIGRQLTEHQTVEHSDGEGDTAADNKMDSIEVEPTSELSLLTRKTDNDDDEDNPWLLGNTTSKDNNASVDEGKHVKPQAVNNKEATGMHEDGDASSGDEWDKAGKVDPIVKKKKKKRKKKSVNKENVEKHKDEEDSSTKEVDFVVEEENLEEDKEEKEEEEDVVEGVVEEDDIEEEEEEEDANTSSEDEEITEEVEQSCAEKLKRICRNAQRHSSNISKDNKIKSAENELKESSDSSNLLKENVNVIEMCEDGDESTDDEGFMLDNTEQARNIKEAFANDDVVAEFLQEKRDTIESSKPKPVDLTLPGWGDWAGPGLTVSKKKRKRFTKDMGGGKRRKDDNIAHLIVNEKVNSKFAQHQLDSVPFPYTSKVEFERSIRQPIGVNWNTPSVHNKLIEPKVRITPGTTIDPIKASRKMKRKFAKDKNVK